MLILTFLEIKLRKKGDFKRNETATCFDFKSRFHLAIKKLIRIDSKCNAPKAANSSHFPSGGPDNLNDDFFDSRN